MKNLKLAVITAIIMTSCVKDDYKKSYKIKYSPEVAAPLLHSSIDVEQIVSELDSTMFAENGDKSLEFRYSGEIYSLDLFSEFINIEDVDVDFEFQLEPLVLADIPTFQTEVTLRSVVDNDNGLKTVIDNSNLINNCSAQFPFISSINVQPVNFPINGASFQKAKFSEGILSVELKNGWLTPLNGNSPSNGVELQLKNSSDNSVIGILSYPEILPGDSATEQIDLAGETVESSIVGEFVSIGTDGTSTKDSCASYSDSIIITVNGTNLVIVSGSAVFPNREVINKTSDFSLDLASGKELENLELKSGELVFEFYSEIEENSRLYIELPYAELNGSKFLDSISVGPGPTSVNKSFDLSGYIFDLTKNNQTFNTIEAKISGRVVSSGSIISFDTSNSVTSKITFSNIQPSFVDGYFSDTSLSIEPETFDFDLGDSEIFEKISFADPNVILGFHNALGLPMEISSLDLSMKRDNDSASLKSYGNSPFPFPIASSPDRGESKTSELILGSSTNISDLINIWPNKVTTGFEVLINPGSSKPYNFALDTSKVDVTLDLVIPIYGTVSGLNITDTIEIDTSISRIFEFVKHASLRTNIDNGLPIEGAVKFYITDENYIVLDSLESSDGNDVLIDAATIDPATGKVTDRAFRQADLIADEDDVNLLKLSGNKIILSATLSTANSGADVKIYSDYSIEIKMGILAKVFHEIEIELSNSGNN